MADVAQGNGGRQSSQTSADNNEIEGLGVPVEIRHHLHEGTYIL